MSRITEINKKAARRKLERLNWKKRKAWQRLRNPKPVEKERVAVG